MKRIKIDGGEFLMGSKDPNDGFLEDYEYPPRNIKVNSFDISATTVTNADFQKFVKETGYQTLAEQQGFSFVFEQLLDNKDIHGYPSVVGVPWWKKVDGANWLHPYGPTSNLQGIEDHPVVHISLIDALAYCEWANAILPTEAEWEYAARAGTQSIFPWGDSLTENDIYHANTWQGDFPNKNTEKDGYLGIAPAKSFSPNKWGLYQMIGNVWEWCRNPRYVMLDDFNENSFKITSEDQLVGEYAIRGGSFLCHSSYCNRYRVAARNGVDCRSSSSHLGFRCMWE